VAEHANLRGVRVLYIYISIAGNGGERGNRYAVSALDCTSIWNAAWCSRFGLLKYPTILVFPAGRSDGGYWEFEGDRTYGEMRFALTSQNTEITTALYVPPATVPPTISPTVPPTRTAALYVTPKKRKEETRGRRVLPLYPHPPKYHTYT